MEKTNAECSECGENREGEIIYQRSPANGDIWVCRTCGTETLIHTKPEEEEANSKGEKMSDKTIEFPDFMKAGTETQLYVIKNTLDIIEKHDLTIIQLKEMLNESIDIMEAKEDQKDIVSIETGHIGAIRDAKGDLINECIIEANLVTGRVYCQNLDPKLEGQPVERINKYFDAPLTFERN